MIYAVRCTISSRGKESVKESYVFYFSVPCRAGDVEYGPCKLSHSGGNPRASDYWNHNKIANYFRDVNVSNLTAMKPVNVDFSLPNGSDDRPDAFSSTNDHLRVMGLRSGNLVYAWIQITNNTWWNYVHGIAPSPQSGTITVHDLTPGASYTVEWWDTYTGTLQVFASDVLTVQANGSILIHVNNLENDVAIKMRPVVHPEIWLPQINKSSLRMGSHPMR